MLVHQPRVVSGPHPGGAAITKIALRPQSVRTPPRPESVASAMKSTTIVG
jgi:hypothetical protein